MAGYDLPPVWALGFLLIGYTYSVYLMTKYIVLRNHQKQVA